MQSINDYVYLLFSFKQKLKNHADNSLETVDLDNGADLGRNSKYALKNEKRK